VSATTLHCITRVVPFAGLDSDNLSAFVALTPCFDAVATVDKRHGLLFAQLHVTIVRIPEANELV
jgi:hypothetical protein